MSRPLGFALVLALVVLLGSTPNEADAQVSVTIGRPPIAVGAPGVIYGPAPIPYAAPVAPPLYGTGYSMGYTGVVAPVVPAPVFATPLVPTYSYRSYRSYYGPGYRRSGFIGRGRGPFRRW